MLIGKYLTVPKGTGRDAKSTYVDRSVVYRDTEEAIVQNVIVDRNEDAMRFAKVGMRKIRPMAVGDKLCLTGDHEILTKAGWQSIADITKDTVVATLNNGILEWHMPTDVYTFDHKDKMYEINNGLISLKTTMNHKMYIKRTPTGPFALEEAKDIQGLKVWYKRDCINKNRDSETVTIPQVGLPWKVGRNTSQSLTFSANDWLTLVGIYLSEGHIDDAGNLRLSVHKPKVKAVVDPLLQRMDLVATISHGEENYRYIEKHQVYNYFVNLMPLNNKYIPNIYLSMGPKNSKTLFDALVLGDGCYNEKNNSWEYCSNSKFLIDGVQILSIMAGLSASITIKNLKGAIVDINGHETLCSGTRYRAYITSDQSSMQPPSDYKDFKEIIDEKFDGYVYCLEIPNHIFMTRRNDKYCWTGNSSRSG